MFHNTDMLHQYSDLRQNELGDYNEANGSLLCNVNVELTVLVVVDIILHITLSWKSQRNVMEIVNRNMGEKDFSTCSSIRRSLCIP